MNTRNVVYPYRMASASSKALAEAMGAIRVYPNRAYRVRAGDLIINWGSNEDPEWGDDAHIINRPRTVRRAANKLRAYAEMQARGLNVCDYTAEIAVAQAWSDAGHTLMARTLTRGSAGRGITVVMPGSTLSEKDEEGAVIQYWSAYVPPANEYRVHVVNTGRDGAGAFIQHKRRRRGVEHDMYVRNAAGGWVFAINDIVAPPERLVEDAKAAVRSLGLTFGAVDCIVEEGTDTCYMLEVNTACGLDGDSTIEFYANAFLDLGRCHRN